MPAHPSAQTTVLHVERSPAKFRAKMGTVEEEAAESAYWMELLIESHLVNESKLANLLNEANEIVAMVVKSISTSRRKKRPRE